MFALRSILSPGQGCQVRQTARLRPASPNSFLPFTPLVDACQNDEERDASVRRWLLIRRFTTDSRLARPGEITVVYRQGVEHLGVEVVRVVDSLPAQPGQVCPAVAS